MILLFLILGAIVNVAVAWGACVWAPLRPLPTAETASDEQLAWLPESGWSRPDSAVLENERHHGIGVVYSVTSGKPGVGRVLGRRVYGFTCDAGFPLSALRGALIN